MLIFGGKIERNGMKQLSNDIFIYNFDSNHFQKMDVQGDLPQYRMSHVAAMNGDYMYILGGKLSLLGRIGPVDEQAKILYKIQVKRSTISNLIQSLMKNQFFDVKFVYHKD